MRIPGTFVSMSLPFMPNYIFCLLFCADVVTVRLVKKTLPILRTLSFFFPLRLALLFFLLSSLTFLSFFLSFFLSL